MQSGMDGIRKIYLLFVLIGLPMIVSPIHSQEQVKHYHKISFERNIELATSLNFSPKMSSFSGISMSYGVLLLDKSFFIGIGAGYRYSNHTICAYDCEGPTDVYLPQVSEHGFYLFIDSQLRIEIRKLRKIMIPYLGLRMCFYPLPEKWYNANLQYPQINYCMPITITNNQDGEISFGAEMLRRFLKGTYWAITLNLRDAESGHVSGVYSFDFEGNKCSCNYSFKYKGYVTLGIKMGVRL